MEKKQQKLNRNKQNKSHQDSLFERCTYSPDWRFEEELSKEGYLIICGIDEAGRGPLAGPVTAACVVFHKKITFPGLNDSKVLNEKKRELLFQEITASKDLSFSIGSCSSDEIDTLNILNATFLAMKRAVQGLDVFPDALLVDGNQSIKGISCYQKTVIKGDARSYSIAAASILAKVTRDRWITEQAKIYTPYEFEKHKGYGTQRHMELLKKYGPCPLHRKSFAPVRRLLQSQ